MALIAVQRIPYCKVGDVIGGVNIGSERQLERVKMRLAEKAKRFDEQRAESSKGKKIG